MARSDRLQVSYLAYRSARIYDENTSAQCNKTDCPIADTLSRMTQKMRVNLNRLRLVAARHNRTPDSPD
ncbi:hypothetical protein CA51_13130 [Rosistilla oblonga]|nr:hypothetical protein CA51_13130 [Rosistilla oblonga]